MAQAVGSSYSFLSINSLFVDQAARVYEYQALIQERLLGMIYTGWSPLVCVQAIFRTLVTEVLFTYQRTD